MDRFVAQTVERFGRLDVMMCNAGFGVAGAIDDISPNQMQKLMDVNYMGTYLAARAALRVFRRQGHGHLIIVSSIVGKRGVPYMGAYSATKFAQVGLAECLRAEVAIGDPRQRGLSRVDRHGVLRRDDAETGATVTRAFGPRQPVEAVAEAIARAIAHRYPTCIRTSNRAPS